MKRQTVLLSLLFIALLPVFGCHPQQESERLWTIQEGFYRFTTAHKAYYGRNYWLWNHDVEVKPMDYVETTVKKVSGSEKAGYGIVFCLQKDDWHCFYRLLINTKGQFSLAKKNGEGKNAYQLLLDWEKSKHIKKGYNTENTLKVVRNSRYSPPRFEIYFNNDQEAAYHFKDSYFAGGYFGFYVQIGSSEDEDFPDAPVDVRFKQHYP